MHTIYALKRTGAVAWGILKPTRQLLFRTNARTYMRLAIAIFACVLSGPAFAGYDLHITRKPHWADDNGPRISISEWRRYVESDAQVIQDKENDQFSFVVSLKSERFPLLYDPHSGELFTKDPSTKAIEKLKSIAKVLHAYVQGDDGEFYPPRP